MVQIMVIDTNVTTGYRIKKILEGHPVEVVSATSGRDALSRAHRQPELVLIDINLGLDDGFEIMQRINQIHSAAAVIIVTSVNTRKAFVRGIRLGAIDYILKPFEDEYVMRKLLHHVRELERGSLVSIEEFMFRQVEKAVRRNTELLVGLIVVYNRYNPTQTLYGVPLIRGLFSRLSNLLTKPDNPDRSFDYRGESARHGNNGAVIVIHDGRLSDKEFIVRDCRRIASEVLAKSDFVFELEFVSIPHEIGPDQKILSILAKKIEESLTERP